jgi:hypothetical protein
MNYKLPSGANLVVSESSYQDANALLKALTRCAKGIPLPKNLMEADVTMLKDMLVEAVVSEEVDAALFKCAERAVYESVRVDKTIFDDPKLREKARSDYFLILWHIVEVNCGPFFGKAFSELRERLKTSQSAPESSSKPTSPSSSR